MRHDMPQPIWLQLKPSRQLFAYLLSLHLAAAIALLTLQAPLPWCVSGILGLAASLAWQWRSRILMRGASAVQRVHWRSNGDWWVTDGTGQVQVYRRVETRLLEPWLTLLRLSGKPGRRWLLLTGDSADADGLRRLRVRLGRLTRQEGQARSLRGT